MENQLVTVGGRVRNIKEEVFISAHPNRVVGRTVAGWSSACGMNDQESPGFFGLRLTATDEYPDEWLILCIWQAGSWLEVNGRCLPSVLVGRMRHPDTRLHSNFNVGKLDNFGPRIINKKISRFVVELRSFNLDVGDAKATKRAMPVKIEMSENTLYHYNFEQVEGLTPLRACENLRKAWIIAPYPLVEVL